MKYSDLRLNMPIASGSKTQRGYPRLPKMNTKNPLKKYRPNQGEIAEVNESNLNHEPSQAYIPVPTQPRPTFVLD